VHAIEVLVNIGERLRSEIEDCLYFQHGQLEVILVEKVCHVSSVQYILLDLGWESRLRLNAALLCFIRLYTHQRVFALENGVKLFEKEGLMQGEKFA